MIPFLPALHFSSVAARCGLVFALLALGAFAAPTGRQIKIEAIAQPDPAGREFLSYEIRAAPSSRDDQPRDAEQAVAFIRTALSGRGLYAAPAGVTPDLTIEIDCGVGSARSEIRSRSTPVTPHPSYGLTPAIKPVTFVRTDYRVSVRLKYITVTAHPHGTPGTVWRVQAAIDDETAELAPCLPFLAAAVMNHAGHDTRGTRTMTLSERDVDVAFINEGLP